MPEKAELTTIKLLHDARALSEVVILRVDMHSLSKWILCFKGRKSIYILWAQRGNARVFKTIDAAYRLLVDIGFEDSAIKIDREVIGYWDDIVSEFIEEGEE